MWAELYAELYACWGDDRESLTYRGGRCSTTANYTGIDSSGDNQQKQCSAADDKELADIALVSLWRLLRLHHIGLPELLLWLWWILVHAVTLSMFFLPYHLERNIGMRLTLGTVYA